MPSSALLAWQSTARARLDELELVHARIAGLGPGRRWGTTQLNRSLSLGLTAQFQSFCRDLHDAAVKVHVAAATAGQEAVLRTLLTQGRKIEAGNPRVSALSADFGRLGFAFIDDLKARGPMTGQRLVKLDRLMDYRNAVVHGHESKVETLEAGGKIRSTKSSYASHRWSLEALARTMDDLVADGLAGTLGVPRPW